MAKPPHPPKASQQNGMPEDHPGADYEVGKWRPPIHSRFRPGQCGNKKGRGKGQRNLRTVVRDTLNQRVKIREGARIRSVSKLDGFVLAVVNRAVQGDLKAHSILITLMKSVGMACEAPEPSADGSLTTHDAEILADYLRRHAAGAENTPPSENPPADQAKAPSQKEKKP